MRILKYFAVLMVVVGLCFAASSTARAQVSFGINIGPQPVCPYGYYPSAPYGCAPYGYYGPEWFNNGIFIGAGPWYHGRRGFHGRVDRRFDPHYGYRGGYPHRGDRGHFRGYHGDFHGHDMRDGHGHAFHGDHGDHGDHGHH